MSHQYNALIVLFAFFKYQILLYRDIELFVYDDEHQIF
jgi:hypothetical protein